MNFNFVSGKNSKYKIPQFTQSDFNKALVLYLAACEEKLPIFLRTIICEKTKANKIFESKFLPNSFS